MTFRERIIKTFKKEEIDKVVLQPRIYYWYYGNGLKNRVPEGYTDTRLINSLNERFKQPYQKISEKYQGESLMEIYDELDISPRYPGEVLGIEIFKIDNKKNKKIQQKYIQNGNQVINITKTPVGDLKTVTKNTRLIEYPLKNLDDIKVMKYILRNTETEVVFDAEGFKMADRTFGESGIVQAWIPVRSPLQTLIIDYMGLENTIYALNDYSDEVESLLMAIEKPYDKIFDIILESPVEILNFGENIDANLTPPPIFEKYLIPYYKKRVKQIHESGKFCHIHMDGSLKPLLPFINKSAFDGIEAATPLPQGDVNLEELKDALGDTILLDGIPAILFIPQYSYKYLEEFTLKILEMFSPNLILGVSDEVPPSADIEKVRFVSEIVKIFNAKG